MFRAMLVAAMLAVAAPALAQKPESGTVHEARAMLKVSRTATSILSVSA
jgi:hypothetical protein